MVTCPIYHYIYIILYAYLEIQIQLSLSEKIDERIQMSIKPTIYTIWNINNITRI